MALNIKYHSQITEEMKSNFFVCLGFLIGGLVSCSESQPSDYTMYVNIEDWTHKFEPGAAKDYPVKFINRMKWNFKGELEVHILSGKDTLVSELASCAVPKNQEDTVWVSVQMPQKEGTYEVVALAEAPDGHLVKSRRIIEVDKPLSWEDLGE